MRGETSGSKRENTQRGEECSSGREEKNKVIWKHLKHSHGVKKKKENADFSKWFGLCA